MRLPRTSGFPPRKPAGSPNASRRLPRLPACSPKRAPCDEATAAIDTESLRAGGRNATRRLLGWLWAEAALSEASRSIAEVSTKAPVGIATAAS